MDLFFEIFTGVMLGVLAIAPLVLAITGIIVVTGGC